MGPNGILCTRWEKEYASVRQTFVACDDCLVKNEAYDAEKKAHTSKRVSIIACNNAISKAQFIPYRSPIVFRQVYERLAFSFCNVHRLRRAAEIVVDKKHDKIRFFHNVFVAF